MEAADLDRRVRLHIYDGFLTWGRPPTSDEAAGDLGLSIEEVEASYRRLAEGRVIVLHPGTTDIRMANPWSAEPTQFTVHIGERSWFGNCVWDALGLVAMLGGDGRIDTTCSDCGHPLELVVQGRRLEKSEGIVHFAVPAAHWWDDIAFA